MVVTRSQKKVVNLRDLVIGISQRGKRRAKGKAAAPPEQDDAGKEEDEDEGTASPVVGSSSEEASVSLSSSSTSAGEDDFWEFELPDTIRADPILRARADDVMTYITEKKTISLEKILTSKLRKCHRALLFELYFIFENSMPNSEERMELRKTLSRLYYECKREYKSFQGHAQEIKDFEKQHKKNLYPKTSQYDILSLDTSLENKKAIYRKWLDLQQIEQKDEEFFKMQTYLNWCLKLPHDRLRVLDFVHEPLTVLLKRIEHRMEEELYGMKVVKQKILLFLHQKLSNPQSKGFSLGLIGDAGVGKTTIARLLSKILDFPFQQISLGGVHHAEYLKGFNFTYVGAQPGEVVQCLCRMEYKNGILFLDEFEKISGNDEVRSFLLHLTDFSQNQHYRDSYLSEISIDLSCLWFIYSMNEMPQDKALADRIFAIHVPSYTVKEKIRIIQDFLLPKLSRQLGIQSKIVFPESVAEYLVQRLCPKESGMRALQHAVQNIVLELSFMEHHGHSFARKGPLYASSSIEGEFHVTNKHIDEYLSQIRKNDQSFMTMYL